MSDGCYRRDYEVEEEKPMYEQRNEAYRRVAELERENAQLRQLLERAGRELSEVQQRRVEEGGTPSGVIFQLLQDWFAIRR